MFCVYPREPYRDLFWPRERNQRNSQPSPVSVSRVPCPCPSRSSQKTRGKHGPWEGDGFSGGLRSL